MESHCVALDFTLCTRCVAVLWVGTMQKARAIELGETQREKPMRLAHSSATEVHLARRASLALRSGWEKRHWRRSERSTLMGEEIARERSSATGRPTESHGGVQGGGLALTALNGE